MSPPIAGWTRGTITDDIHGADDDPRLRSTFTLVVAYVGGGSPTEREYADSMTGDYLQGWAATLNAMRRLAATEAAHEPTTELTELGWSSIAAFGHPGLPRCRVRS